MLDTRPTIPPYIKKRATDSLIYLLLAVIFLAVGVGVYQGSMTLAELEAGEIDIRELPGALALSFLRMLTAYIASLGLAFLLGILAARTRWGERVLIPLLDILQSVPVVGFLPAAIAFFISITNEHRLGIEIAAVFLIFTSQAWNLAFAVYEAVKGIPRDNLDAVHSFGIRGRQEFWRLFAPVCIPRLVYNSILSWSNGWFFLVACEIIAQGPVRYDLPGIGSFLARAAEQDQISLVLWGLAALTALVMTMDTLIWRPATAWAEKFKQDQVGAGDEEELPTPITLPKQMLLFFSRLEKPGLRFTRALTYPAVWIVKNIVLPLFWDLPGAVLKYTIDVIIYKAGARLERLKQMGAFLAWGGFIGVSLVALFQLGGWLAPPWPELVRAIPMALIASTGRLLVALLISLAWILPVVLYVWNRPRFRGRLMTVAQIGASLPAIALFPLIVHTVAQSYGMELASIVLLITGMQWYILFNCLGGTATIPRDVYEATRSFGLSNLRTWRKLVFPAMRPALITGTLTAWGGGWNALVVAEYVTFKDEILTVNGIGSLLNYSVYQLGDNRAIALCLTAMVGWILLINLVFWRPIYKFAIERYKFEA